MNLRTVTIVILLLLAFGSWKVLNTNQQDAKNVEEEVLNDGYYMIGAEISDADSSGRNVYALEAERIDHVPADDSIHFTQLSIIYDKPDASAWKIFAQRGSMGAARDVLTLIGDVRLVGGAEEKIEETKITTKRLTLDVTNNTATTEDEVTIEISGAQLNATGLRADFDQETISLLSDVEGRFEFSR